MRRPARRSRCRRITRPLSMAAPSSPRRSLNLLRPIGFWSAAQIAERSAIGSSRDRGRECRSIPSRSRSAQPVRGRAAGGGIAMGAPCLLRADTRPAPDLRWRSIPNCARLPTRIQRDLSSARTSLVTFTPSSTPRPGSCGSTAFRPSTCSVTRPGRRRVTSATSSRRSTSCSRNAVRSASPRMPRARCER